MLLAVGLALGGYCALLAWRRPALAPLAEGPLNGVSPLPEPARLPPREATVPLAPTPSGRPDVPAIAITLRITNLPPAWRQPTCGVAIGTDASRDGLTWVTLPAAAANGVTTVPHHVRNTGPLTIAIAATRADAVHGYLVRRTVSVDGPATFEIDAAATPLTLRRNGPRQAAGPFRIVRPEDPEWLAVIDAGAAPVWLPAGRYELRDPLHGERRQSFTAPIDGPLEISAALAPIPADRP